MPQNIMNDITYIEEILAIFPNVLGFGYAFFQDIYLPKYYGMSIVKPPDNKKCLERIIAMIQTYQPTLLLLPTPDGKRNRKRKRIQELLQNITDYAKENNIAYKCYSREQIRLVFEKFGARSKLEIADKICSVMTEMEKYKPVRRKAYMP
jgi:hypothetical protein